MVTTLNYLPYGELDVPRSSGPDIARYKFATYERDAESGLDNANARMYNPQSGTFASADTVIPGDGERSMGYNRYAYAEGMPTKYNDPTGHGFIVPGHNYTGDGRREECSDWSCPGATSLDEISKLHDKDQAVLFGEAFVGFGKNMDTQLKAITILILICSTTAFAVETENKISTNTPTADTQKMITEPNEEYRNVFYANAGGFFWLPSFSIGYQRKAWTYIGIVVDVNYGERDWQDVNGNSRDASKDNLNLTEAFWTTSFMLRFFGNDNFFNSESVFNGFYASLIATYYQDNLSITKGTAVDGQSTVQGEVFGNKKISGLAIGAEIGWSYRHGHLVFFTGFGFIFALPQNITYTITNNGAITNKSLARGIASYAFSPRLTIAIGYAF